MENRIQSVVVKSSGDEGKYTMSETLIGGIIIALIIYGDDLINAFAKLLPWADGRPENKKLLKRNIALLEQQVELHEQQNELLNEQNNHLREIRDAVVKPEVTAPDQDETK